MRYHNYMAGLFFHLKVKGYKPNTDKDIGGIRLDSVYARGSHVLFLEYKTVTFDFKKTTKTEKIRYFTTCGCKQV